MSKPQIMTDEEAKAKIPNLPRGYGTISWVPKRKEYMYRKTINGDRKYVYGKSVNEVMKSMEILEKDCEKQIRIQKTVTLFQAMLDWVEVYKKSRLKTTSYDTLRKTITDRIGNYPIGMIRLNAIDSDMLQKHLNELNSKAHLSYSTIKKCYDALNDFFRHSTNQRKFAYNPMETVEMLHPESIIKQTKKICFFEADDLERFLNTGTKLLTWSGKPMYQYGFCLCANMFLGMRAGELLALKWKDVDFDTDTIWVHENLQLIKNPDTSENKKQQIYTLQSLKNYQNRHIHMSRKAKYYLQKQHEYSEYTSPDDYVCCTRDGKHAAITYLSRNIKRIEKAAGCKVREHGTHIIRHTCASMYFRKGVRIELIAALLGHSVEVCRSTYIHFVEEQKKAAVELIDDFDVDPEV